MEDRAAMLQRRIAAYRRHLAEGADLELARSYLEEMIRDQAELDGILQRDQRR